MLNFDYTGYENGVPSSGNSQSYNLAEDIEETNFEQQGMGNPYNLHYVDKKAADSEVKKVCKK